MHTKCVKHTQYAPTRGLGTHTPEKFWKIYRYFEIAFWSTFACSYIILLLINYSIDYNESLYTVVRVKLMVGNIHEK